MALAVAIGAFGAHGLKPLLSDYHLEIFKTANFYHFIHGIALFISILIQQNTSSKTSNATFYSFIAGIILFSGSLYILSLQSIYPNIPGWLGAITPLGGLAFIIGWSLIAFESIKNKK